MAAERKYDFVFAHLRTPHEPFIYNRFKNDYDPSPKPESTYLDNLELTDRVLAAAWEGMSATGTWDDTAATISSDHWWRAPLWAIALSTVTLGALARATA